MNKDIQIDPPINLEKSIEKKRLVYQLTSGVIFDAIFSYLLLIGGIFISSLPILIRTTNPNVPIWVLICSLLLIAWMISGLILRNAVVSINGKNIDANRTNIIETLNEFYEDLEFQVNDEKILRSMKPAYKPIWGRIITVIFDNEVMLLNISKLGKDNSPNFIHGFTCYLKAKKIAKYFEEKYPPSFPFRGLGG